MRTLELVGGPKDGQYVPDTGPQHYIPIPPRRRFYEDVPPSPTDTFRRGVYELRRGAFTGLPYYEWQGIE